jgi:hypothetical protein
MRQCGARPRVARISCLGALLALACSSATTTTGTNVDGAAGADLGGAALLTAETTSVDFGLVFLGDRSSSTFYVTNAGGNALARPTLTVDNAVFRVSDRCLPGGIAPGDGCEVLVEYFPTRAGEQTGTLTITALPAPTAKVALAGRGLPAYARDSTSRPAPRTRSSATTAAPSPASPARSVRRWRWWPSAPPPVPSARLSDRVPEKKTARGLVAPCRLSVRVRAAARSCSSSASGRGPPTG